MTKLFQEYRVGSKEKKQLQKSLISQIRLGESYVSLFLGIVVVVIGLALIALLFRGERKTQDISSVKTEDIPAVINKNDNIEQEKYTISAGDTLWTIAEKKLNSGYRWDIIAQANNISDPTNLKEGNQILIPKIDQKMSSEIKDLESTQSSPSANTSKSEVQPGDSGKIVQNMYTVVPGDTLWDIAVRAYGDGFRWHEIAETNELENPDLIFSGNVFKIPR